MRLTGRDFEILIGLARNGFLNVPQIQQKWFSHTQNCTRRLRKLRENELINVTYIERFGCGIYYLTKYGLNFINDYMGYNYKGYAKSTKMNHFVSCGDFYLNFPHKIAEYEIEYYLESLIPDIYVKYNASKTIDLFVEIDNKGERRLLQEKIKNYEAYFMSNEWKERFSLFPRCIIVTDCKTTNKIKLGQIPFKFLTFNDLKEGNLKCLS